jgi:hypothetical protein
MLLRDQRGRADVAGEPDLDGICVALQQKRFWAGAGRGQDADQKGNAYRPCGRFLYFTPGPKMGEFGNATDRYSEAASISVSIS